MATHSSVLAWRIPGTGEPGGLPSMGSHRLGHDWSDLAAAAAARLVLQGASDKVRACETGEEQQTTDKSLKCEKLKRNSSRKTRMSGQKDVSEAKR